MEGEASLLVQYAAGSESVQPSASSSPDSRHGEEHPDHGSQQSSQRLLAYSDALISIIATVMILPVCHTKIRTDQELEESLQQLLTTKIAVYIMTFLIVTVAWGSHVRLFQVIEQIDDILALLNLACMMLMTFLPYSFSLMASFPNDTLGILSFCICAIIIGLIQIITLLCSVLLFLPNSLNFSCKTNEYTGFFLIGILGMMMHNVDVWIQAIIVLYGFHKPYLLNSSICTTEDQLSYKYQILKVILFPPGLFLIAGIMSFIYCPAAYAVLAIVIFLPYITECTEWCGNKIKRPIEIQRVPFYTFHPNAPLSKERVEAFSDGVFAIVATLLILDICEDNVPESKDVVDNFHGKLFEALSEYGPEFLAYFGSFVTVGLLWFVHHSLFLYITKTTRLMGLLNTFSLAFIGGLPLAFRLTHEFAARSHNEIEAIQISCVIIFLASLFQFAIWVAALHNEKETLHHHIRYGGKEHAFMFAKLSLYPSVAFITFCLTYVLGRFSTEIFHVMQIIVPFAFILLRIIVQVALIILSWLFGRFISKTSLLKEEEGSAITVSET